MKIRILKTYLTKSIQNVSKAIPTRSAIPILNGIKLDVDSNGITLTASNMELTIQSFIPITEKEDTIVEISKMGSVVFPAKFFVEIVKKLPASKIDIEVKQNFQVFITAGTTQIELAGLNPEQFPFIPTIKSNETFAITSSILKNMIKKTVFSVSMTETAPILNGVCWSLQNNELKFIATDRHRLAYCSEIIDHAEKITLNNVVISGKCLNELSKIIPEEEMDIHVTVANNQILFEIGRVLFFTRLLEGNFPDTTKIIPTSQKTKLVVDTKTLNESIERAFLLSRDEKVNIVRVKTLNDNKIEVSSSCSDLGKVKEEIEVVESSGSAVDISFNSKYTLDVLKVIESEQIIINFTGGMQPIVLKPMHHNKNLYIILPYRTTN